MSKLDNTLTQLVTGFRDIIFKDTDFAKTDNMRQAKQQIKDLISELVEDAFTDTDTFSEYFSKLRDGIKRL